MEAFINWISEIILAFWLWLLNLAKAAMATLLKMLKDLFYWVFETIMDFVITLFDAISLGFEGMRVSNLVATLPQETREIIGLIRLDEAIVIILGAILIRITLQLVPFTRLGS